MWTSLPCWLNDVGSIPEAAWFEASQLGSATAGYRSARVASLRQRPRWYEADRSCSRVTTGWAVKIPRKVKRVARGWARQSRSYAAA